jgi:hypothetical protein
MGANKISCRRSNSAGAPNSQPKIPTRVYQVRVVTTDLPTLGTNPKQSQRETETQGAQDLTTLRSTRRTVRKHRADCPCGLGGLSAGCGGPSENNSRTSSTAPSIMDHPFAPLGQSSLCSRTVCQTSWPRAITRTPNHLSFHESPKRLKLLRKDLGEM